MNGILARFTKAMFIIFSCFLPLLFAGSAYTRATSSGKLTILFTHDLHSHFLPHPVSAKDGARTEQGGYAKLAHLIKEQRARRGEQTLLIDAGDFSMGTLFHTAFMTEASELSLMGKMGYEVLTLGNHDFDFHLDNLARMLQVAKSRSGQPPFMVASNVVFTANRAEDLPLKQAFQNYPISPYRVLEKNGIRIGLFGIMGKDAAEDTPFARPVTFADPIESSKKMVELLKNQEKADIIVCLSHTGTSSVKKHSEDENIAREVPQIDVIISGHTHTVLPKPLVVGKTVIVSAGCYGAYLGILDLDYSKERGIKVASYALKPVTPDIPDDREIAADIARYKKWVDQRYFSLYGYHSDQVVAESDFAMEPLEDIYANPEETGLGNMITDAYRYAVAEAEGEKYEHIHLVVQPLGLIRDSLLRGSLSVSDVFRVLSLGLGTDGKAGYPLVAFHITGKDVKNLLEIETSVAPLKTDAHLQLSGMKLTYNPHRIPFDRVRTIMVREAGGLYHPLEAERLYRVGMNFYTASMVEFISRASHGLIRIDPKDKQGRPLRSLKEAIIELDGAAPGKQELKEWAALAAYMKTFPDKDGNGIPNIPDQYRRPEGRFIAVPSWNPFQLIAGGNYITYGILGAGILIFLILGWLIWVIKKRIPRV